VSNLALKNKKKTPGEKVFSFEMLEYVSKGQEHN
jgi:hypothetical protein